jgi:hypothetical protein
MRISGAGWCFIAAMLATIGGGMNLDAGKPATAIGSFVVAFICLVAAMYQYREDAA